MQAKRQTDVFSNYFSMPLAAGGKVKKHLNLHKSFWPKNNILKYGMFFIS